MRAEILPHQLTTGQYYAVMFEDITLGEISELESQGFTFEMCHPFGGYLFIFKHI